ncbi:hypothetical protein VNO77_21434 [Canavalia gladiata]|uniref:Uncharacterized protein n=1 Tax=Canavalia gladiata TaxID=3824 RepID=A0AAN9LV83_CANGL
MPSMLKLLSLVLFLGLVFKADADFCSFSKISIDQTSTGNWAHGKPEWKISIIVSPNFGRLSSARFTETNFAADRIAKHGLSLISSFYEWVGAPSWFGTDFNTSLDDVLS